MKKELKFKPEIPEGWKVLRGVRQITAMGSFFRIDEVKAYIKGKDKSLKLEPEPNNQVDRTPSKSLASRQQTASFANIILVTFPES